MMDPTTNQEEPPAPPSERTPFRWTERRVARLASVVTSAAVVAADIVLFVVYQQNAAAFVPPWRAVVPIGIAAILLFAGARLRRQIRLFREDR
jgi:peptidoglycan/LPS O-acetylase OafA/YrhL